jgi:hypothetical protein
MQYLDSLTYWNKLRDVERYPEVLYNI